MTRRASILATVVAAAASIGTHAANWPQWRGPGGQGVSDETGIPLEWSVTRNVDWKTPVAGQGHSQPIVWGARVFLTAAVEGAPADGHKAPEHRIEGEIFKHPDSVGTDTRHRLSVLAFNLATGKPLWERTAYEGTVFDDRHKRSSYAAATPVTDGTRVYAYFGPEGVYAYDFDGNLVWKASVGQFPLLGMGTGTSPLLYKNRLIIQRDENAGDNSFIAALDTATGREVWRTARKVEASWSTPVLVDANGRTELVTNGSQWIVGYDPGTGRELWRAKGVESNAIHTPVVGHGLVIVTAGFPAKKVIAIRPGGSGDITGSDRIAWQYRPGNGVRRFADSVRRIHLPGQRQGPPHLSRRQDG